MCRYGMNCGGCKHSLLIKTQRCTSEFNVVFEVNVEKKKVDA